MVTVSIEQLLHVMPGLTRQRAIEVLPGLSLTLEEAAINNRLRVCHFLSQVGHESLSLRYVREIASGAEYEGRKDLGNTHPGDGRRYPGRGFLQVTGRANARAAGAALNLPLEAHPEMMETTSIAWRVSGWFWETHGLNLLADKDDVRAVTKRINGGLNGYSDRKSRLTLCKSVFPVMSPKVLWVLPTHEILQPLTPTSGLHLSPGQVLSLLASGWVQVAYNDPVTIVEQKQ